MFALDFLELKLMCQKSECAAHYVFYSNVMNSAIAKIFYYIYLRVNVWVYACHGACVEVRGEIAFQSTRVQTPTWWQVPFPH